MKFDRQKNDDIHKLKKLSKLRNHEPYRKLKLALMKKYSASARTVERWLVKRAPGVRKTRTDSGKIKSRITALEKKLTRELIEGGVRVRDVKLIVQKKTGKKISNRKINRARGQFEVAIEEHLTGDHAICRGAEEKSGPAAEPNIESGFGDASKELFRKLFELDLIAPERGIGLMIRGKRFAVPKEEVEDICLILANAWNESIGKSYLGTGRAHQKYKVDKNVLRKIRIMSLIDQQIRLCTTQGSDTKQIESLTRMYDKMSETIPMDANLETLKRVCRALKQNISDTEIYELVKANSTTDE